MRRVQHDSLAKRYEFAIGMSLSAISLCAILLCLGVPAHAQQPTEARIAVIGAPEEPRFSELVSGLRRGLGELGYAPKALLLRELKIPRAEEKAAKGRIEDLLRWGAQVCFLIGSRLLKPV